MLPLSSGSELLDHTYAFSMIESSQVGEARRFAQNLSLQCNLDEVRTGRVGIIVNELGNNLVRYAQNGQLLLRRISFGDGYGVEVLSIDQGPGLSTAVVMEDGFTTGSTPGQGLGSVKRQADVFDIFSQFGRGTAVLAQVFDRAYSEVDQHFEIGAINIPIKGEHVCGDAWSVRREEDGLHVLVADGLGHGPLAHHAAMEAVEVFNSSTQNRADNVVQLIHGRLKSTRGAAVFLVNLRENSLDFLGAGNIRAIAVEPGKTKTLISQNGTAGIQIRAAKVMTETWSRRGFIVLHSDGLASKAELNGYPGIWQHHPAIVAAVLYRDFNRGTDDSTVLVIKAQP